MNYNGEAPFVSARNTSFHLTHFVPVVGSAAGLKMRCCRQYGFHSSNHLDQGMPYFDAMAAFVPQGRAMARLLYGCPGIQVPGGIGPQVRSSSFRKLCRRMSDLTLICVAIRAWSWAWRRIWGRDGRS